MSTKPSPEGKERKAESNNSKLGAKDAKIFFGTKILVVLTSYFTKYVFKHSCICFTVKLHIHTVKIIPVKRPTNTTVDSEIVLNKRYN